MNTSPWRRGDGGPAGAGVEETGILNQLSYPMIVITVKRANRRMLINPSSTSVSSSSLRHEREIFVFCSMMR